MIHDILVCCTSNEATFLLQSNPRDPGQSTWDMMARFSFVSKKKKKKKNGTERKMRPFQAGRGSSRKNQESLVNYMHTTVTVYHMPIIA